MSLPYDFPYYCNPLDTHHATAMRHGEVAALVSGTY
jgi:hypothetical protein